MSYVDKLMGSSVPWLSKVDMRDGLGGCREKCAPVLGFIPQEAHGVGCLSLL